MGTIQNDWWEKEFRLVQGEIDYLSHDGTTAVEIKKAEFGSRGLHSAIVQLAIYLEENPVVVHACLVLYETRMSLPRLKAEWQAARRVLRAEIAERLGLIVIDGDKSWSDPVKPYLQRIASILTHELPAVNAGRVVSVPQRPGQSMHEVWKVLICRWLRRQGPIAVGKLAAEVGCSYPTVRKALDQPSLRKALQTNSKRSVDLKTFPHDSWRELVVLSSSQRNSIRFRDASGEKPTPQGLLKRLERNKPLHLALGGVLAARHWHSNFDLHGTPRLDVVYHAPDGSVDLEFVRAIDPALTRTDDPSETAALVVHPLIRAAPLFIEKMEKSIPWADPVETALDLCDLSLTTQANQLLTHLRPEVRLA